MATGSNIKVELIVDKRCIIGEGAIWHTELKNLMWIDIEGKEVMIYDPKTHNNRVIKLDEMVGTIVPRRGKPHSAAVGLQSGFGFLDLQTGAVTHVVNPEAELHGNRFNDGKCDPEGRFWAGSMKINLDEPSSEPPGSLYCLFTDLTWAKKVTKVTISNGLVWSLDKKTMYYIDSVVRRVDAFDYNNATAEITNRRAAITVPESLGLPDGSTLDSEGMIWVAHWGAGCVCRWDPINNKLLQKVDIPGATQITSCAFGGDHLDELYVTSAAKGKPDEPKAGSLFVVKGLGIKGLPAFEFHA